MKRLTLTCLLLSGCAIPIYQEPNVLDRAQLEIALKQQAATVQLIVNYIAELQAKGVLPKPEQPKAEEKKDEAK